MKLDSQIESELWALDKQYTRRGIDIAQWSLFDLMQFVSAAGFNHLWFYLYEHGENLSNLLTLVRLANLTKADLQAMFPTEKKAMKRVKLYQRARVKFLKGKVL